MTFADHVFWCWVIAGSCSLIFFGAILYAIIEHDNHTQGEDDGERDI